MAMNKKEKTENERLRTQLAEAQARLNLLDQLVALVVDEVRDEIEQIARDAADEVVDDLQISR